jgi:DNA-binding GntR family transcriptional regulator
MTVCLYPYLKTLKKHRCLTGDHLYIQQKDNEDFHRFIYSRCRNDWLNAHIETRLYYLIKMCKKYILKTSARAQIAIVDHAAIADVISSRDPDFAEMLMRRHIQGTWKALKIISVEESLKKYEAI